MITPDDIKAQHLEITAKTGKSQKALNKELRISQTHLDRVLEEPVKYAKRIAKLKIKGDEILKEYEDAKRNKSSEPPTLYGGKVHDDENENDLNKWLNRIEFSIGGLRNEVEEKDKKGEALINRFTERDNAYMDFLTSAQTEEDKKILRTRLEQAEQNYHAAITKQEALFKPIPPPPEKPIR